MRWRDLDSETLFQVGMVLAFFSALAGFAIWIFKLVVTRGGTI